MTIIERDGARIAYDVSGSGAETVVLGHSLLCGRFMWEAVLPALEERFRVINVEVRGHLESTAPRAFTLEDLAEDWRAILDAEGVERAHLVGLSMGGMTALRFALRHRSLVGRMVLLDTSGAPETRLNRLKYKGLATLYRRVGFNDVLAGQVLPLMFAPLTVRGRPPIVARLIEEVRRHRRQELVRAIEAVTGRGELPGLGGLDVPTRVLVGEHDAATPPRLSRELVGRLPDAGLATIAGAGHLSAMERPDDVATQIVRFLEKS